jgi:hypothetical protein
VNLEEYALTEDQEKKARRFLESLVRMDPMPYMSCPFYERCEVQVCPMDPMKTDRIWFSDEGPCINPEFSMEQMVITQKKLAKKRAEGYFTYFYSGGNAIFNWYLQLVMDTIQEYQKVLYYNLSMCDTEVFETSI